MSHGITSPTSAIQIDYIEFPVLDIEQTKRFYADVFGWTFQDYGDAYSSFNCGNLTGGFAKATSIPRGGALIVLYAKDLAEMQQKILDAGGKIVRQTFSFPGGRRFHFTDTNSNELAVWSDM